MKIKRLGNSDLWVTPIGLGSWAIGGGDNPYGWGAQDDDDSIRTIQHALDLGINWIDTAKGYGHGHSEEIVGQALKGRRDKVIVATKCGILWKEDGSDIYGHLKAASIKVEVESSLKRLQMDMIDLYQIHWPLPDEDIEEGWRAISDLIDEGKVRYGGVSNFNVEQMKRIAPIRSITSLQPPYSMIKPEIESEILPYCAQQNIGVIVYSPMQAGLLSGKFTAERAAALPDDDWRKGDPNFQEPILSINLKTVERLKDIAARNGISMSVLAIAWTLRRPEVTAAIVGARRPSQIEETVKAGEVELNGTDWQEIEGLLARRTQTMSEMH
ncbi:MAG TPA: aldo/keto reductase [Anaerolineaceae bacterium]|nr:aldo/keto reductase [Anaerolineaceae bacterium]